MYIATKQFEKPVKCLVLSISLVLSGALMSSPIYANQNSPASYYQIQAGPLSNVLNQVAQKANVSILFSAQRLSQYQAPALTGNYTVEQAFKELLKNTPFQVQHTPAGYLLQEKNINQVQTSSVIAATVTNNSQTELNTIKTVSPTSEVAVVQLAPMVVYGEKDRDTQGYDDVYDKNYSTAYAGKDLIERFKGTTPSDLFKGMSNVYSGDARNSGALDPNIRGIQGEGRIPLTIDGTEQALTVWRGYNGANNRNYIDPNLISSIQVVKGAGLDRNIKTGIGGGVAVKTLEVDDVLLPGKTYGIEVKVEGATNSTKERVPPSSYIGRDYRDVAEELGIPWSYSVYSDPLSGVVAKEKGNDLDNFQDKALRIAVATKQDNFDLLAAYAYRDRGNYFAGNNGSDFFKNNTDTGFNFVPYMAKVFSPNKEVTNTSNRMESYLLKGTWKPTDDQILQATYRDTNTIYGEIMPSRIEWWDFGNGTDTVPQWQLSEINAKSYSLDYRYNPVDNRWVDLKASLWQTDTDTDAHNAGGFPHFIKDRDFRFDYGMGRSPDSATVGKDFTIRDTTSISASNTRKGVSLSNKFNLLSGLDLTLGADITKEKLVNSDEYYNDATLSRATGYRMLPRAGRRSENQYHFNFDWEPTTWLSLSAGAKSTSYWSFDDFLNDNKGSISGINSFNKLHHMNATYTVIVDEYTDEMLKEELSFYAAQRRFSYYESGAVVNEDQISIENRLADELNRKEQELRWNANIQKERGEPITWTRGWMWYADENGKFSRENNKFLNGDIDLSKENLAINNWGNVAAGLSNNGGYQSINTEVNKKKDNGWAPAVSAVIKFNPNSRLYLRYNEAIKMPSLFETTLGFSASQSGYDIKPEHAYSYEVAYIHDLKDIIKNTHYADIKIAYFRQETKDVIERDRNLVFINVDKQIISGWELQGRYDNGLIFSDLSLVYNQKNQVCDVSLAILSSPIYGDYPECVDFGFPNGYLINMALPKYQANVTLGTRLFDNKLELGTRATYFHKFINPLGENVENLGFFNSPLSWDSTYLLDAYAHYQHNENIGFDFVGTNLTNQYYLDPISRSAMPAPGRTFKLAMTYTF